MGLRSAFLLAYVIRETIVMIQPILCPICKKPAVEASKSPFCSERCRKIDFFRWWDGRYAITEPLSGEGEWGDAANFDSNQEEDPELFNPTEESTEW